MIGWHRALLGLPGRLQDRMKPPQALTLGFLSYAVIGTLLLSLPFARVHGVDLLDNLFNVVSAISTTGLTTVSVADNYSRFGQAVFVVLFQLGGIGYMTLSSFIILARRRELSPVRQGILRAEFALPRGFEIGSFVRRIIVFSTLIELLGILVLYAEFRAAGVPDALWSAVFHCVSAFATAGFSLDNNSLVRFADNGVVNLTIGVLCYVGAIGFIVLQDAWLALRHPRQHRVTLTSRIILLVTAAVFLVGTPLLYFGETSLQVLPPWHRLLASAFQVMSASSTAGFNSIPIGQMSAAGLTILILAMLIGASPSGTGGGIKTTSISALYAILGSVVSGRNTVTFLGHEVPAARLHSAVATSTLYLTILGVGLYLLTLTQSFPFLELFFEASSALGTVGLSMGITGNLDALGKGILILLMFIGRVGPLTLGLSLFQRETPAATAREGDLAV